jgi:hypothetical protein
MLVIVMISPSLAKEKKKKNENEGPIPWGMLSQSTGCLIFKEHRKTTGMFWGVAVTTKTFSVLEVVETQNYTLEQKQWKEDQENMDKLNRLALKDKIKFVKIPKDYSEKQLERARSMCKEPSVSP